MIADEEIAWRKRENRPWLPWEENWEREYQGEMEEGCGDGWRTPIVYAEGLRGQDWEWIERRGYDREMDHNQPLAFGIDGKGMVYKKPGRAIRSGLTRMRKSITKMVDLITMRGSGK